MLLLLIYLLIYLFMLLLLLLFYYYEEVPGGKNRESEIARAHRNPRVGNVHRNVYTFSLEFDRKKSAYYLTILYIKRSVNTNVK